MAKFAGDLEPLFRKAALLPGVATRFVAFVALVAFVARRWSKSRFNSSVGDANDELLGAKDSGKSLRACLENRVCLSVPTLFRATAAHDERQIGLFKGAGRRNPVERPDKGALLDDDASLMLALAFSPDGSQLSAGSRVKCAEAPKHYESPAAVWTTGEVTP